MTYAPSLTCSTYPSRRSVRSREARWPGGRPVSREICASVTPSPCCETDSSTRRAYCTEWNGAVGSGFNATASPNKVVTASFGPTIAAGPRIRGGS